MQKLDLGVDFDPEVQAPDAETPVASRQPTPRVAPAAPITQLRRPEPIITAPPMKSKSTNSLSIILLVVALAAGGLTGIGAFKLQAKAKGLPNGGQPLQQVAGAASTIKAGDVFGSADSSTFKDSAEGYLQIGGFQGEGSHHLLRPGGDSQTVYLVSSITDLDKFDGMQVKVWGETNKGQKVGWLMDVGRVEVENPQGTPPAGATQTTSNQQQPE